MKRLVVNAFRPGKHKVITRELANSDLRPGVTELISAATG
jgi:hypothetical protein